MAKWEVKQLDNDNYIYVDENGNKSEEFYRVWPYTNGFGLVRLKNDKYAYRDIDGNLSAEFDGAKEYSNGFGRVQFKNGKWAYRDVNGNLSEGFRSPGYYIDGFGAVRLKNWKYAYRDVNGNLSEEFEFAYPYINGFGEVQFKNGKYAYRDILGNVDKDYTKLGKEAYEYYKGEIDETELSDEAYADAKFLKMIIERVRLNKAQAIDLAESEEQLKIVKEYYSNLIEYIKTRALEIHENKKAKQEAERHIEEQREELNNNSELEF